MREHIAPTSPRLGAFTEKQSTASAWTTVELPGLNKDGQEFPLELSLSRRYNRGEYFFTGMMRDSRRKKAEYTARYLANIVESSSAAIFRNLGDSVTSWNITAERLYGYPVAEMIDQSGRLLLPPDKFTEDRILWDACNAANASSNTKPCGGAKMG